MNSMGSPGSRQILAISMIFSMALMAWGQVVIIDDDLNLDTSSDYTIINGGHGPGDGSVTFAYDYSADSLPPAPSTTDASTTGVKITVNETANNPGLETEAFTVFHNTEIVGVMDYTLTVDVYASVWSPADTGSTEHVHVGVGGDGSTVNQLFQASPFTLSGSGHYVVVSNDGGDSSDYRHWRDNANGSGSPGPVNNFDPDYLAPDMNTNVVFPDNFLGDGTGFFDAIANDNAAIPGSIGNGWSTIKVEVSQTDGKIRYFVRGDSAATTGDTFANDPPEFLHIIESDLYDPEGFASFGLGDLYNSVATDPTLQFTIFDNFRIEGTNLPNSGVDGDFDNNGEYECADVDALVADIAAGNDTAAFDLTGDGVVDQTDLTAWLSEAGEAILGPGQAISPGDATLDGVVDVSDFGRWNSAKFTATAAWCNGDFNASGTVDVSDYTIWNSNKFRVNASLVPEPASLSLLLFAGLSLFSCVRRR